MPKGDLNDHQIFNSKLCIVRRIGRHNHACNGQKLGLHQSYI